MHSEQWKCLHSGGKCTGCRCLKLGAITRRSTYMALAGSFLPTGVREVTRFPLQWTPLVMNVRVCMCVCVRACVCEILTVKISNI